MRSRANFLPPSKIGHAQHQLRVGVAGLDFAHVTIGATELQFKLGPQFGALKFHSAARHNQVLAGLAGNRRSLHPAAPGRVQRLGLNLLEFDQAPGIKILADRTGQPRQFVLRAPVGRIGLDTLRARLVEVAQHFVHLGLVGLAQRQLLTHRVFLFRNQPFEFDTAVENPAGVDLFGVGHGHIRLDRLTDILRVETGGGDQGAGFPLARADAAEGIDRLGDLQTGSSRIALVDADVAGLVAVIAVAPAAGEAYVRKTQAAGFGEFLAGLLHPAAGGPNPRVARQRVAQGFGERVGGVAGRGLLGVGGGGARRAGYRL